MSERFFFLVFWFFGLYALFTGLPSRLTLACFVCLIIWTALQCLTFACDLDWITWMSLISFGFTMR